MDSEPNGIRGEVTVKVGDVTITMAPTMGNLARLSKALDRPLFSELYRLLVGTEIDATRLAIRNLTIGGTSANGETLDSHAAAVAALDALMIDDLGALQAGFIDMFKSLTRETPAGGGTAAKNG